MHACCLSARGSECGKWEEDDNSQVGGGSLVAVHSLFEKRTDNLHVSELTWEDELEGQKQASATTG